MAKIGVQNFGGMIPIKDATVLPDNNASYALNTCLYSSTVIGWRQNSPVFSLQGVDTGSVYRIPATDSPIPGFQASTWLEFEDPYMAVCRSSIAEDSFNRYYFFPSTGFSVNGPYYNTLARILAGDANYILGIPAPETAPGVAASGGSSSTTEARTYVYTWQSTFGEEGPPSPVTVHTGKIDDTWTITLTAPLSGDTTNRTLAFANIYRTVTDTNGNASFFRVGQVAIGTTSFTDSESDATASSGLALSSEFYTSPPADLQGTVVMANGIFAGWSNKREIWFSAAFLPHAWPATFAVTVDADIVGIAAVGSSLIVLTETVPWIFTGITPDTMTGGKIICRDPCISRGSIAPAGEGVYYASPNGLILVNTGGTTNETLQIVAKEQWIGANPYNFAASKYAEAYVAFVKGATGDNSGIIVDQINPTAPFCYLGSPQQIVNVYNDELSSETFIVTAEAVYQWNPPLQIAQSTGLSWDGNVLTISGSMSAPTGTDPASLVIAFLVTRPTSAPANGVWIDGGVFALSGTHQPATGNSNYDTIAAYFYALPTTPPATPDIWNDGGVIALSGIPTNLQQSAVFNLSGLTLTQAIPFVLFTLISGSTNVPVVPWTWKSKKWRFPFAQQFVGGKVYFEVPNTITIPKPTAASRNTDQTQSFNPATQYLLLSVYADDRLVLVREIIESGELINLPSGFKATYWQFEFEGQVQLLEFGFATSIKELQGI